MTSNTYFVEVYAKPHHVLVGGRQRKDCRDRNHEEGNRYIPIELLPLRVLWIKLEAVRRKAVSQSYGISLPHLGVPALVLGGEEGFYWISR